MGIPKIIHYCWFGGNLLPERARKCIESWKKFCPDYEIQEWNEDNYDVHKIQYMDEAYKSRKWAFVSDYARLDIVFSYGGIYLDTDVELIKSLDELLDEKLVLALEKQNCKIATGLGFAAEAGNVTLWQMMMLYHNVPFLLEDGRLNLKACPQYTTELFLKKGFVLADKTQRIEDALILSSEYLCPIDYHTGIVIATENTLGIHWYEASWFEIEDKKIHLAEQKIRRNFPSGISNIICFIYRKSYRLIEYTRKGILLKKIKPR